MTSRAVFISPPWWIAEGSFPHADTFHEQEKPTHSKLLGPDGRPLPYKQHPIGFDLRPKDRK